MRQDVLPKPVQPVFGDNANTFKIYTNAIAAFNQQDEALRSTKAKIIQSLDNPAQHVIAEPIYGHIRRTIPQILQLLHEAYGHMSLSQLFHLKANWQAQRWQPDENLITFMFNFQTGLTFLQQHQYAPPPGEVVNILQNAIDHVPALANPAKEMFFQQHPQIAEQWPI